LLLVTICAAVHAQSGFVRSGNQTIPGATVTATQDGKNSVTTTDQDGHYAFPSLGDGVWTFEVQMFGFEPAKKQVDYVKSKSADFNLQLRQSPMAGRMAQPAGNRSNGQANQLESQIQSEVNSNQAQSSPPAGGQNSNEAFLISGSLSQGLSPNAVSDSGPNPQFGGRDPFSGETPNVPGFGGGGPGGFGGRGGPGGGFGGRGGGGGGGGGFGRRGEGGQQGRQFGN